MKLKVSNKKALLFIYILIPLLSALMHWQVFNMDIVGFHSWRQTLTQTNIINFYEEDFNIFNPRINQLVNAEGIYRMEFPLMQWLFAGVYKVFGNHIFISRFLSFLIGWLSIIGIFHLFRKLFKDNFLAVCAAWVLSFSPLFYYYNVNPMPDNFALMSAIWGLFFFTKWQANKKLTNSLLSGIFLSLSIAAKLPFVFYTLVPLTIYLINIFRKKDIKENLLSGAVQLLCFLPSFAWYLWVIPQWSNGVTSGVANTSNYDLALVASYIWFHLISTLPEVIVNYLAVIFFLSGIYFIFRKKMFGSDNAKAYTVLLGGIIFYFLFEINMIEKVHDYYLMPFLIPVVLLVIIGIKQLKWNKIVILCLLLLLPLTAWLRMNSRWDVEKPGFNKDLFVYKSELRESVPDSARIVFVDDPSPSISLYYLHKKGWTYQKEEMSPRRLKNLIEKRGAQYLFCDENEVVEKAKVKNLLKEEIGSYGSIRVFELAK